jgi:CIC family chloride channel protein
MYSDPEFESEAMMPAVVASVIGYSLFMAVWGAGEPLVREARHLRFASPLELVPYALLGPLCGLVSILLSVCFFQVHRHLADSAVLPRWLRPAVGGLMTGAIACLVPPVVDSRYHLIQGATDGSLFASAASLSWWTWTGIFGAFVVAKCLATAFTVGSGAAGGLLGPSLFLGGAVGAFLGALLTALVPGSMSEPLRQALIPVGMGGVLAASMRVPIAAIVMVTEMTGSYQLIVPLMLVCATSYLVGRRWGLNREQVPTSADSPVHAADAMIRLLESWRVRDFVQRDWPYVVSPATPLGHIVSRIEPGTHPIFAVVAERQLRGLITLPDIDRIHDPWLQRAVLAEDIMTERLTALWPDDDLYEAVELFRRENHDVLPVLSAESPHAWEGMLTRQRVYSALSAQIETSRQFILQEYAGLIAMDQEAGIDNLLKAVAPQAGLRIERLMVPLTALGKSIRACDFRQTYGIQILGLELPDGTVESPPDIERLLEPAHRLIALVPQSPPTSGKG